MNIKVMKEVEVPDKYCYDNSGDEVKECQFVGQGYIARCVLFNENLETAHLVKGDDTLLMLPCKECLVARKRAIK